ncbi:hypothetical protein B0H13DRAFT_2238650 [Mycena leptocephala]|nr:hypothetical protein B0H13DRAFT_2238650 [Mycena leptocephala]
MIPITTSLTQKLGLKTPIVSAPMGSIATPAMAAAVTAAGGFGCIGAAFDSTADLKTKIHRVRDNLGVLPGEPVPLAVGFIGWILDTTEKSEDPRIPATLDERTSAIWLAFGADLTPHITAVRAHDVKTGRMTLIFVQVGTVADALRYAPLVDCVVVQGTEAGGHGPHGSSVAPPLFSLLQAVLHTIPPSPTGPIVLATGGISTGAQIAALLTMGAAGVVLGTRFLFTADLNATVCTLAYDEVNRTMGWPPLHDGRAIRNRVMDDVEEGLSLDERLRRFDESKEKGEDDKLVIWAGVAAGLTNEIMPAADVLREFHEEAVKKLSGAARLFD